MGRMALLTYPSRFQRASAGCRLPAPSVALLRSATGPGLSASHPYSHVRHAYRLPSSVNDASPQLAPPSVLTSTEVTGASPDQASPRTVRRPRGIVAPDTGWVM